MASWTVGGELIVATTPPAASVPWKASANSGQLGANRASTSPGAKPRAASPVATRSAPPASCPYVSVRPLAASIRAGLSPSAAARASTKRCTTMSGIAMSGCGLLKSMAPARVAHGGGRVKSALGQLRLAHPALMQLPDGLDGIRLIRAFVRAVAHDAREAQRQAARIRRARLDAVEGDLHHQLGPHVHHVSVASRLELEQLRRLPLEHLVRHPFERLPEHREASTVTGPKVKIGEPAAAAAVAPFGGEHDEVEGVSGLQLEPCGAARASFVARVQGLGHQPFLSGRCAITSPSRMASSSGRRRTVSTTSGTACVTSFS